MAYIKFNNAENLVSGSVVLVASNIVRVKLDGEPNLSGFSLYLDKAMKRPMSGNEYEGFNTLYKQGDGWYELSNDGSVYIKPVHTVSFIAGNGMLTGKTEQTIENYTDLVIPTVEAAENYEFVGWNEEIPTEGEVTSNKVFIAQFNYIPTLEEVKTAKIAEMEASKHAVFGMGFNVVLSDGSAEHFNLSDEDKLYLTALQTQVLAGVDPIPWHVSDSNIACKNYSNTDMGIITQTALSLVVYHETYINDITRYINSIETKEEVAAVIYGMPIPEGHQSEPLKNMLAQMNA